ncbi:MAG: response regulator transcription factor [Sedimentisphaerales bacterium]|jgi:FixJ family two-component response regulator|nr:response regulator transcription factor [Sedimentisphaerales bacterium]NLZ07465.1 response regulator transcription factor [Phycisphaerae bacterium]HNY80642.1 response regulator transcription factor [Sedimentisphaerales bacterium]HOC62938.1 response regulator transcription factor [Sedimentisphaerales bacterium]HOH66382.1 response regulator transcription factor [Sedimentisphaerales bacterium]
MSSANPTVFVVDDDEAIRQSLCLLIEDIGLNVKTFGGAREFLAHYDPSQPGCLVLDVRMSGMSGLELQARLRELNMEIPTVIITGHGDVPMAVEAMKAGAMDFIEKPFRDQVLLDSIQRAVELDRRIRAARRQSEGFQSRVEHLTRRERQVMDLLVIGKSNKTIAYELGISQKTVDFHRTNVLSKTGVASVVELVRWVHEAGCTRENAGITKKADW